MNVKLLRSAALAAGMLLALTVMPATQASADSSSRAEHQRIVDFWTKDKVAQAKPRDFVRDPATGTFTQVAEPTAAALGAPWVDAGLVQKTTGKVLFAMGKSYYVCSASVVEDAVSGRSIVVTAAHCVFDNKKAQFATNWLFVPDYDSKPVDLTRSGSFCAETQFGCWTATALVAHRGFTSQRRFNTEATLHDYAFAVVGLGGNGKAPAQLDQTVGDQEIVFETQAAGADTHLFGYPAGAPYEGRELIYSQGPLGTDPLNDDLTYRVPSDMTGGSSGGPWYVEFAKGAGVTMSVNSYGYSGIAAMHGPKFDAKTAAVYDAATTAAGNTIVG
ncbi:trypsin-like serine peptidase [Tessaracoccus sp. G1721]